MPLPARIGVLFLALALTFFAFALRDYRRPEARSPFARRAWIRVAIIFTIVGLGLQFLHLVLGR